MLYGALEKAKILGNAFIDSQFNYTPLIWTFCRKTLYSKIEKIHHTTLKVVYGIDAKVKVKSGYSVFEFKTKIENLGNIDCECLI